MIAALTLAAFFTSIVSALIGMGGGVVLLSLMTFSALSAQALIPLHGIVQLASNSSRGFLLRRHLKCSIILPFTLGLPLGALASFLMIKTFFDPRFFYFGIAGIIFFALFKPKKMGLEIPLWAFFIVGLCTGFLSLLVGATGPFLAPFFLRSDLSKHEIIANKAFTQFLTHLLKIPAFFALGFSYKEHAWLLAFMVAAVLAGSRLGVALLGRMNDRVFYWLFRAALGLAACRVLYKAIWGL